MVFSLTKDDDYESRKAAIARQEKLAEMLSQMGAQEQAVSTAGGITAPMSGMGALARGLTSFGGSYLASKASSDEAALKKASLADALAYFDPNHDVNIPGASTDVTLDMPTAGNAMAGAPKASVNPEDLQGQVNAPSVNPEDLQAGPTPVQPPGGLKMPDISSAPQKYTLGVGPSTGTATYSPEEQMARARAAQFSSNPLIRSAAAGEMTQIEAERDRNQPKMVAVGANGVINSNPNSSTYGQMFAVPPVKPSNKTPFAAVVNGNPGMFVYDDAGNLEAVPGMTPFRQVGTTQPTSPDNALLQKMVNVGWGGLTPNEREVLIASGKHPPPSRDQEAQGQMVLTGMPLNQIVGGGMGTTVAKQAAMDSGIDMYIAAHPGATRTDAANAISAAQQDYKAGGKAVSAFRDPNSRVGQNLIAGDTAIQHLDVFVQLARAMKTGDVKLLNQAKNAWQNQFGVPAPNNIALAGQYVSNELERASLGQAGTGEERKITAALHSGNLSYDTLLDAANTDKAFVSGRLKSVRNSWPGDTGRPLSEFDTTIAGHLNPETRRLMGIGGAAAPGAGGTTPASGGTRLTAEQAAKLPPDTAFVGMDGVARRTHK